MLRNGLIPADFRIGHARAMVKFEEENTLSIREVILIYIVNENELESMDDVTKYASPARDPEDPRRILVESAEKDVSLIFLPSHIRLSFFPETADSTGMKVPKKIFQSALLIKPEVTGNEPD